MRIVILINVLIIGVLTANSSLDAQIQMGSGMKMDLQMDEETTQIWKDLINRRVAISPVTTSISKSTRKVSLEFYNPSDDTLEMEIKVSNEVPQATKPMNSKNSKTPKSIFSEKETEVASIYKPMDKWITNYPKKLVLAPGEKKTIDVEVSIPESLGDGEYVSWIVAEVAPRKTLLAKAKEKMSNPKLSGSMEELSVTISSSKILYGSDSERAKESKNKE